MDGIHDLGGKRGFGHIKLEADLRPFPERWHGAVFTMINTLAASGITQNIDQFRHAVERIDPACYLTHGYYGRWLGAAETLLVEAGMLTQADVSERAKQHGADSADPVAARPAISPDDFSAVPPGEPRPTAFRGELAEPPAFQPGEIVRTLRYGVSGHTRLPAYARDAVGEVVACHGAWVYPDANAHGKGEQPNQLYTISFAGEELWGNGCEPGTTVCLDLFEPYLMKEA